MPYIKVAILGEIVICHVCWEFLALGIQVFNVADYLTPLPQWGALVIIGRLSGHDSSKVSR